MVDELDIETLKASMRRQYTAGKRDGVFHRAVLGECPNVTLSEFNDAAEAVSRELIPQETVKAGRLTIRDADGSVHVMQGVHDGPHSAIRIHDETLLSKLRAQPEKS